MEFHCIFISEQNASLSDDVLERQGRGQHASPSQIINIPLFTSSKFLYTFFFLKISYKNM